MLNLKDLLSSPESEILEFKEAKNSYDIDKLGKYFSALSNEANLVGKDKAYLLFGVKDDKTIVGTNITDITKGRTAMPDIVFKYPADFTEHERKATLQTQLCLLCKKELAENSMLRIFFKDYK